MYNPYPIDPLEVAAFLHAHDVNAVVGKVCDDGDCPLARFLNAQYPGSRFFVDENQYSRSMDDISLGVEPDATFPLEPWAQAFVSLVDDAGRMANQVWVTALDALWLLAAACEVKSFLGQEG